MKKTLCILLAFLLLSLVGCSADYGETVEPTVSTKYDLTGQLVEISTYADGSRIQKTFRNDGSVENVVEFNSRNQKIKATYYKLDASILRTEAYEYTANGTTIIERNGDGVETKRDEDYTESYDGGIRTIRKTTEDGIITFFELEDIKNNGLILNMEETVSVLGTTKKHWTTGDNNEDRYSMTETVKDGQVVEYTCERDFKEGNVSNRKIVYIPETNTYQLTEVTMKNPQAGAWQDVVTTIPAEEYVKADWEIFE